MPILYAVFSVCCTLCPCDCSVITNLYFLIPLLFSLNPLTPLSSSNNVFWWAEVFNIDGVRFISFVFLLRLLPSVSKNPLSTTRSVGNHRRVLSSILTNMNLKGHCLVCRAWIKWQQNRRQEDQLGDFCSNSQNDWWWFWLAQ